MKEHSTIFFHLFLISICPIIILETMLPYLITEFSPLAATAMIRTCEIISVCIVLKNISQGFSRVGMSRAYLSRGIRTGVTWSIVFALTVLVFAAILQLNGLNLLTMVASKIPFKGAELFLFFLTGGLIAPVAEEILFRGLIYSLLRRLNFVVAIIVSTMIFAGLHYSPSSIPLFQIIGGVVFALAFERSKSLAAPIIIHSLGNLAIFSISVYVYQ